jgi:hypothetical protein
MLPLIDEVNRLQEDVLRRNAKPGQPGAQGSVVDAEQICQPLDIAHCGEGAPHRFSPGFFHGRTVRPNLNRVCTVSYQRPDYFRPLRRRINVPREHG